MSVNLGKKNKQANIRFNYIRPILILLQDTFIHVTLIFKSLNPYFT